MKHNIILIIYLFFVSSAAWANLTVLNSDGSPANHFVIVENYGIMKLHSGIVDVVEEIHKRQQINPDIEMPDSGDIKIFIPPTNASKGTIINFDGNKVIILEAETPINSKFNVKTFLGARVVQENGVPIPNAFIFADGYSSTSLTRPDGTINQSFYIHDEAKEMTIIVFKDGFRVFSQTIPRLGKDEEDGIGRIPLAKEDIVLKPAENQVITVNVRGSGIALTKGHLTTSSFYLKGKNNNYSFVYRIEDGRTQKTYGFEIPLDVVGLSKTRLDRISIAKTSSPLYETKAIAAGDLPKNIPRVGINIDQLNIAAYIPPPEPESTAYDDGTTKTAFWFIFIILSVLSGLLIAVLLYLRKEALVVKEKLTKSRKLAKDAYLMNLLASSDKGKDSLNVIHEAEELCKNTVLDSPTKTLIEGTISQLTNILMYVYEKACLLIDMNNQLLEQKKFLQESLGNMEDAIQSENWDIAELNKVTIEECESVITNLSESCSDLSAIVEERKKDVAKVINIIKTMSQRAALSIKHTQGYGDLKDLTDKIQEVMEKTVKSFNSKGVVDTAAIKDRAEKRRSAQNTGIDANSIGDMKKFLSDRQ